MEARTFVAAVALLATTILLQSSLVAAAPNAHVVGGSTGWTIPPNTSFYSDWSSSQTITAGDTLVFNFPTGFHTVAEVPKSSFDSCSTTKQIGSTFNNGPATVTVASGTHYYICSIPGHCSAGMKLALTVAAGPNAHVVGGSTGWTIPPNTSFYSDWSSSQTIAAGDTLVFNFPTGFHTVAEVTKSSFDSCSTTKQIGSTFNNGPATVIVTPGTHYYICSIPGHCSAGMKLALTVSAAAIAPSVSAAPPTPPTVNRGAPAPAPKASAPTPASPAPATVHVKAPARTAHSPAPTLAPEVAGPTSSTPVPAAAPVSRSLAPTAVPKLPGPTASSPAPSDKNSAASPTGSVSTVPGSTANPPAAPGSSNSSPALPGAAGMAVALLTVATVSFLL